MTIYGHVPIYGQAYNDRGRRQSLSRALYSELGNARLKSGSLDAEAGCGALWASEDPAGFAKDSEDMVAFGGFEGFRGACLGIGGFAKLREGNLKRGTLREDDGALDEIFEFADI